MRLKALLATSALVAVGTLAGPSPAYAQSEPFIGQLGGFGFNFCPRGWADTNGALLSISTNTALFSLLGTTYGGDGRTTFGLPDLRGRTPVGDGTGPGLGTYNMGQAGGSTSFTLTTQNMPSHTHTGTVLASPNAGDTNQPVRNTIAAAPSGTNAFLDNDPPTNAMHPNTLSINSAGNGVAVQKVSPYLTIKWCIATQGIFPSRS